jgi:uncharacterized protein
MTTFVIDLGPLPQGASRVRLESDAVDLGLPAEDWPGPIVADILVERGGDRVSVRGELSSSAHLECVRCLRRYEATVRAPLETFADRAGTGHRGEEEELERDDYMRFHDGRQLDLREDVRESLLLELPMAPHCRDDCRGLCPRCGADLNEGPCECTVQNPGITPDNPI